MTTTPDRPSAAITFGQIAFDAVRAEQLAGFWSALLDRPVADGANEFFAVIAGDGSFPGLMFLAVPEPRTAKNRVHLDLVAAEPATAVERALALGATRVGDFDEYGTRWTTLADPEGNVFDLAAPHDVGETA